MKRIGLYAVGAALIAAATLAASSQSAAGPRAAGARVSGVLAQSNSRDGAAILSADNLAPGHSASGEVTISNTGDLAGDFELGKSHLTDTPGAGGRPLSEGLLVEVEDMTTGFLVYKGALGAMPVVPLGTFRPGEAHTYRFTVDLPDRGPQDNLYAGASTTVEYDWVAREAPADTPAAPTPAAPTVSPPPARPLPYRRQIRVRIRVPRRQRITRQRGIYLRVRCDRPCVVDLAVRLKARARAGTPPWRLRRALPGARTMLLKLALRPQDVRRLRPVLRNSPHLRILVAVRAADRSGRVSTPVRASASLSGP